MRQRRFRLQCHARSVLSDTLNAGITICAEEKEEHLSYTRIKCAFESLHLWLVVCDDECALLLQKKDLRSGNADSFLSDIISKMNTGTDVSG